jgi:MoaA/NifB/PqqE/SkfB family radical SAM enzyme
MQIKKLKNFYKLRSKLRSNLKFLYWRLFIPINRLLKKKYIPQSFYSIETTNVCNLKCVFCGYQKFEGKFKIDDFDEFKFKLEQVATLTDSNISLTPLTGDVFTDKNIISKLQYIDNHPGIKSYGLTTNFILPTTDEIIEFISLKKLGQLKISIYGHDEDSFLKIAKSKSYKRLIRNLIYLKDNIHKLNFEIDFAVRSYMDFSFEKYKGKSDLIDLIIEIEKKSDLVKKSQHFHYTNWGGTVTKEDIGDLDIILKDDRNAFKSGPCTRLYSFLICADKEVILCACRDTHRYMKIGHLDNDKLKDIVSLKNPLFKKWVDDQEKNIFNGPCKACDMYEPIYAKPISTVIKSLGLNSIFKT